MINLNDCAWEIVSKNTCYSFRGHGFGSHDAHGGSQPSPLTSKGTRNAQHTCTQADKTLIKIPNKPLNCGLDEMQNYQGHRGLSRP